MGMAMTNPYQHHRSLAQEGLQLRLVEPVLVASLTYPDCVRTLSHSIHGMDHVTMAVLVLPSHLGPSLIRSVLAVIYTLCRNAKKVIRQPSTLYVWRKLLVEVRLPPLSRDQTTISQRTY